jgi:hypothetical protein
MTGGVHRRPKTGGPGLAGFGRGGGIMGTGVVTRMVIGMHSIVDDSTLVYRN